MRRLTIIMIMLATHLISSGFAIGAEVDWHGTVSQGYLSSSSYNYLLNDLTEGTYSFNETILNVSTKVDDKTRIGVQLLGRDLGSLGNNMFIMDWGFGDYRLNNKLGFRVGKIKTPIGLYNKTRDVDAVRTSVLLPQSVYTESFRTIATAFEGGSFYGNIGLGENASLDYEVLGGTVEMKSSDFMLDIMKGVTGAAPILDYDIEASKGLGLSFVLNAPIEGLRFGYTDAKLDWGAKTTMSVGLPTPWVMGMEGTLNSYRTWSVEYIWSDLVLAAEYQRMDAEFTLKNVAYPDGAGGLIAIEVPKADRRGGYYLQGAYRLSDRLEVGSYYSVFYPDWEDKEGETTAMDFHAWQKDLALTLRVDLTENWLCKAEFHFMNGTGDLDDYRNTGGFNEESWDLFALKSSFYF